MKYEKEIFIFCALQINSMNKSREELEKERKRIIEELSNANLDFYKRDILERRLKFLESSLGYTYPPFGRFIPLSKKMQYRYEHPTVAQARAQEAFANAARSTSGMTRAEHVKAMSELLKGKIYKDKEGR